MSPPANDAVHLIVREYPDAEALPPSYRALLEAEITQRGLFRHPAWFAHLMQHFFADSQALRWYGVEGDDGRPLLLAPLRRSRRDYAVRRGWVAGAVSNPENYSSAALMFAPGGPPAESMLEALFRHLGTGPGRVDAVRIWPFAQDAPLGQTLQTALVRAGYGVQTYANSFNRYEDVAGLDYATYFAGLSANMRYNVRRRRRALERRGRLDLELLTTPEDLERALPEYIAVSNLSWKAPETMFNLETYGLLRLCALQGSLRLGVLRLDGEPLAVQFWIVSGGVAHCARLAYREDARPWAPGVVLTGFMIAHVLDADRVVRLDYGYGRDEYKRGWMREAREYYGVIGFNRATLLGRLAALWNIRGHALKEALRGALAGLGWRRGQ